MLKLKFTQTIGWILRSHITFHTDADFYQKLAATGGASKVTEKVEATGSLKTPLLLLFSLSSLR